jgi:hypothetical protein
LMDEQSPLQPEGVPLRLDTQARSAVPYLPAFLARPKDAPVYHGFPMLENSRTDDGWCFGTISEPDCSEGRDWGDAFVVAPDGSRAGIFWEVGAPGMQVSLPPHETRWSVFQIGFARRVHDEAGLVEQLSASTSTFGQGDHVGDKGSFRILLDASSSRRIASPVGEHAGLTDSAIVPIYFPDRWGR